MTIISLLTQEITSADEVYNEIVSQLPTVRLDIDKEEYKAIIDAFFALATSSNPLSVELFNKILVNKLDLIVPETHQKIFLTELAQLLNDHGTLVAQILTTKVTISNSHQSFGVVYGHKIIELFGQQHDNVNVFEKLYDLLMLKCGRELGHFTKLKEDSLGLAKGDQLIQKVLNIAYTDIDEGNEANLCETLVKGIRKVLHDKHIKLYFEVLVKIPNAKIFLFTDEQEVNGDSKTVIDTDGPQLIIDNINNLTDATLYNHMSNLVQGLNKLVMEYVFHNSGAPYYCDESNQVPSIQAFKLAREKSVQELCATVGSWINEVSNVLLGHYLSNSIPWIIKGALRQFDYSKQWEPQTHLADITLMDMFWSASVSHCFGVPPSAWGANIHDYLSKQVDLLIIGAVGNDASLP